MLFKKVQIAYNNSIIINGFNAKFPTGELCGLIGPSGCGKSTLLKSIFNHSLVKNGIITYQDKDVLKFNKKELLNFKKSIFYLRPENNLVEDLDFYQNLLSDFSQYKNWFYRLFKILTKTQKEQLFDILTNLKVQNLAFQKISKLSSGQKQRLSIAKMIFNKPKIILADEPTSNLDIENTKVIFELLNQYKIDNHVIVAIHDLNAALSYFDKLFVFDKKNNDILEIDPKNLNFEDLKKYYET